MKLTKDQIILDIFDATPDISFKISGVKKQKAAQEYKKRFKTVANNSNRLKPTTTLLKLTPALLLLTIGGLDLIVSAIPGNSIIYSILATAYFFGMVVTTDKAKKFSNFKELCEENFLIEEINELDKTKPKELNKYLHDRNKRIEELLSPAENCELTIEEPYHKLIATNNNEIIVAEPISYDTETRILEYNLYNETECLELPSNSVIQGESPVIKSYLYVDILNSKALLYQ